MTRVLFACWPFEGHVFPHKLANARLLAELLPKAPGPAGAAELIEQLAGPGRVRSGARTKNLEESWS